MDLKTIAPRRYITDEAIEQSATNLIPKDNIVVVTRVGLGKLFKTPYDVCISQDSQGLILKDGTDPDYLVQMLKRAVEHFAEVGQGTTIRGVTKRQLREVTVPLPPLEVQREIVSEIEGYQRVIDGARAVVENWRPRIAVDPEWPVVELGEVCEILDKFRKPITKGDRKSGPYPYYGATGIVDWVADYLFDETLVLIGEDGAKWDVGDATAFAISGKTWVNNHAHVIRPDRGSILDRYLITMINQSDLKPFITGVTVPKLNQAKLRSIGIPLAPMAAQNDLVKEIELEKLLVDANGQLIERMEDKVRDVVGRLWGN